METGKAQQVVQGMKEAGINFAVGLPDSQFHEVYEMITQDSGFQLRRCWQRRRGRCGGNGRLVWR